MYVCSAGACRQVVAAAGVKVKSAITNIDLTTADGTILDINSLTAPIYFLLPLDINLTDITADENTAAGAKEQKCQSLLGAETDSTPVIMTPEMVAARLQW